jgi:hypothetical protein
MKQVDREAKARGYIRKHFPILKDVEPAHTTRRRGESRVHVYTFKKEFAVSDGAMSYIVRVLVNEEGKIVKAISSK